MRSATPYFVCRAHNVPCNACVKVKLARKPNLAWDTLPGLVARDDAHSSCFANHIHQRLRLPNYLLERPHDVAIGILNNDGQADGALTGFQNWGRPSHLSVSGIPTDSRESRSCGMLRSRFTELHNKRACDSPFLVQERQRSSYNKLS